MLFVLSLVAIAFFSSVKPVSSIDCYVGSSAPSDPAYPPESRTCAPSTATCERGKLSGQSSDVYLMRCASPQSCQSDYDLSVSNPSSSIYSEVLCCTNANLCNAYPNDTQPTVPPPGDNSTSGAYSVRVGSGLAAWNLLLTILMLLAFCFIDLEPKDYQLQQQKNK